MIKEKKRMSRNTKLVGISSLLVIVVLLFCSSVAKADETVDFTWDHATDINTTGGTIGYELGYGIISGDYLVVVRIGMNISSSLTLPEGSNYIAARSYDANDNLSVWSNEVFRSVDTVPPFPPSLLREGMP